MMKKLLILGVALVVATSAHAGQRPFEKLDKDGSATISKEEFLAQIKPEKVERMSGVFADRDKNKDGSLTLAEYTIKEKPAK